MPRVCVVCHKDCHHEGRTCSCVEAEPKVEAGDRALETARKILSDPYLPLKCALTEGMADKAVKEVAALIQSAMDAQEREWREALQRFGRHSNGCQLWEKLKHPCTCGWAAVFDELLRVKQIISPLPSISGSSQVHETRMDTGDSQTAPSKIDAGGNTYGSSSGEDRSRSGS